MVIWGNVCRLLDGSDDTDSASDWQVPITVEVFACAAIAWNQKLSDKGFQLLYRV